MNFIDLNPIVAGTEVLKPQGGDEGCPKFNFLESNFELATEIKF
jgi:hypothetical protein